VIRDLIELRRHGQVRRRVDDLSVPVHQWRATVRTFARQSGFRVRTGVVELLELSDPHTRRVRTVPVVFAARLDAIIPDGGTPAGRRWRPSRWDRPPAPLASPRATANRHAGAVDDTGRATDRREAGGGG
jgi:hypothetical protein